MAPPTQGQEEEREGTPRFQWEGKGSGRRVERAEDVLESGAVFPFLGNLASVSFRKSFFSIDDIEYKDLYLYYIHA